MMLDKFSSGEEHSVSTDHTMEGSHQCVKEIPKLVVMAALLDPRTKSAIGIPGIPVADRDIIWQSSSNKSGGFTSPSSTPQTLDFI
jgi:hypothetical protein